MKRTKFPVKTTPAEIMANITKSEKARLLSIQSEIQNRLINIKKDIYCIGELLHEAKSTLPHGKFMPWIEIIFDKELPYNTAYFYMKVYEVFKGHPKTIQLIPSKYLLMITSQKFPDEIIQVLNEHPDKINKKGLEQINELYDLFKHGTIGGSQFLKLAEKQIKVGIDIWKGKAKHRLNTNMRQSLYFGASDVLKRINYLRKTAREMSGVFPVDPDNAEHKKLITHIDKTIIGLQELKVELGDNKGLLKQISTKDGDKFISNL